MLHHHNPYIAHYARVMVIRLEQNILRIFDYLFYFRCLIHISYSGDFTENIKTANWRFLYFHWDFSYCTIFLQLLTAF